MLTRLVIFGGPGDGDVVAETVRAAGAGGSDLTLHGFLNDVLPVGALVAGAPVLGKFEDWASLPEDLLFIPVNHRVENKPARVTRMRSLCVPKARWATVVHPTACIAPSVVLGPGSYVASFVSIQPGANIGSCVSIRAGANIGHDSCVGDFAYIGPNASLCGNSIVKEGAHVAPNAVLLERRTVGRFSVVGIGAAVMKNVEDYTVVIGNPARKLSVVCRSVDDQ